MLFNSLSFAVFFPVVTILYFLLPQSKRWSLLLVASCFFYMFFRPVYILILFFTIAVDYTAGILIERSKNLSSKKGWLIASILANVSVLAFFKYYHFFIGNISILMGMQDETLMPIIDIVLPIGLSFHTFQAMSYTIEVYRGNFKAERHLGYYSLYVMFYPQLVAGPIERPQHLLTQFREHHAFDYARISKGLRRMLWGFFKKMVIADRLAYFVDAVYTQPHAYEGMPLIWATLFFSIQIYCDFSGYCDIAIGAAQVMGINLMENFRSPYFASSIREFWTRWHISLSSWFRDYLYIPLGGNSVSMGRWMLNILIVFNISGLWHGANWTFVIWGFLHGVFLIAERFMLKKNARSTWMRTLITFFLVSFAWIFFRATSIENAFYIVTHLHLLDAGNLIGVPLISKASFEINLVACFCILVCDYAMMKGWETALYKRYPAWRLNYLASAFMLVAILMFGMFEQQSFIYFQF